MATTLEAVKADIMRRRSLVHCPSCDSALVYRLNLTVRGIRSVDDIAAQLHQAYPDYATRPKEHEGYRSEAILCPSCEAYFQLELDVRVLGVREISPDELAMRAEREAAARKLPDEWMAAVEGFGLGYLMDAFMVALRKRESGDMPNDPRKYLTTFLRCAQPMQLKDYHCDALREWGAGSIEVYQFQSIAMVVTGGEIRGFIPNGLLASKTARYASHARTLPEVVKQRRDLEIWIRTRNGYVVRRGLMFDELKGKRPGEFAKAVGNY